jgi:hypothetical protein
VCSISQEYENAANVIVSFKEYTMFRFRHFTSLLLIACMAMLLVSTAAANPGRGTRPGKSIPRKARVTWTPKKVQQTLSPGQTTTLVATFTSSTDLENVSLRVPGNLARVVTLSPTRFANIKAGEPVKVNVSIAMPAENAKNISGSVQVWVGNKRNVATPLSIIVKLPEATPSPSPEP